MSQPHAPQRTLGEIIDSLGCSIALEDGDLIEGAIILLKVNTPSGTPAMVSVSSGVNWMEFSGMTDLAYSTGATTEWREDGPDEDE
jgi:hypothetical protein